MFYAKVNSPKTKHARTYRINSFGSIVNYGDENLLPLSASVLSYNVSTEDGALKGGKGFEPIALPQLNGNDDWLLPDLGTESAKEIFYYRRYDSVNNVQDDRIIVNTGSQRIYELKLDNTSNTFHQINDISGQTDMIAQNYRLNGQDVLLLCTSAGIYTYDGTNATLNEDTPYVVSMCVLYERAFAVLGTDRYKVWFSDELDPTNWNVNSEDGGYIELADDGGAVIKVISFLNYVYIFREYGIVRLTATASQSDFSTYRLFTSSGRIYGDTVTVCGNKIIFFAEDGLYCFDGVETVRILPELDKTNITYKQYAKATYHNGCYYLAARIDYGDGKKMGSEVDYGILNTVIEYDLNRGRLTIVRGVDAYAFCVAPTVAGSCLMTTFRTTVKNVIGMLTSRPYLMTNSGVQCWKSGYTDIGYPEKYKVLRSFVITTDTDINVKLNLDGSEYEYTVYGKLAPQKIRLNRKFYKFGYEIECVSTKMRVTDPVITLDMEA